MKVESAMSVNDTLTPHVEMPFGHIEQSLIDEFIRARGYDPLTLAELPPGERDALLREAAIRAPDESGFVYWVQAFCRRSRSSLTSKGLLTTAYTPRSYAPIVISGEPWAVTRITGLRGASALTFDSSAKSFESGSR